MTIQRKRTIIIMLTAAVSYSVHQWIVLLKEMLIKMFGWSNVTIERIFLAKIQDQC